MSRRTDVRRSYVEPSSGLPRRFPCLGFRRLNIRPLGEGSGDIRVRAPSRFHRSVRCAHLHGPQESGFLTRTPLRAFLAWPMVLESRSFVRSRPPFSVIALSSSEVAQVRASRETERTSLGARRGPVTLPRLDPVRNTPPARGRRSPGF